MLEDERRKGLRYSCAVLLIFLISAARIYFHIKTRFDGIINILSVVALIVFSLVAFWYAFRFFIRRSSSRKRVGR